MPASERFFDAYLECALWSSTDSEDNSLEGLDVDTDTLTQMQKDCDDFVEANATDLEDLDDAQSGHDFWLTRNGHGAGFWERGLGEVGERLTKACKSYGDFYLYVGDDGLVYC